MSCIRAIKFKIHHVTQDGVVMFVPIRDEDNLLVFGALHLDTGKWPSITEQYRKAAKENKKFIFNGEKFREVA